LSKLKLLPYRELKKVAEKCGFQWARCVGSHNTFKNSQGKIVVIPDHGSQPIAGLCLEKSSKTSNSPPRNTKSWSRTFESGI